jgi:hypothetical protein
LFTQQQQSRERCRRLDSLGVDDTCPALPRQERIQYPWINKCKVMRLSVLLVVACVGASSCLHQMSLNSSCAINSHYSYGLDLHSSFAAIVVVSKRTMRQSTCIDLTSSMQQPFSSGLQNPTCHLLVTATHCHVQRSIAMQRHN